MIQVRKCSSLLMLVTLSCCGMLHAQTAERVPIPPSFGNQLSYNSAGVLQAQIDGRTYVETGVRDRFTLQQMYGAPVGTDAGIAMDFHDDALEGSVSYGTYNDSTAYPEILFLPRPVEIKHGKALLELKKVMAGTPNDFLHIMDKGTGVIGYRVLNASGHILYEGRVAISGKGPFVVEPTLVEGPLVNMLTSSSVVLSYETQVPCLTSVEINGKSFSDDIARLHHEIALSGLQPDKEYPYTVRYGARTDSHRLRTAPPAGSQEPFSFAFVGNNRAVKAGGESDFGEVNYLTTRAGIASAVNRGARFMQALGGNSTGNNPTVPGHMLDYANWKRALEPFWSGIPVYAAMGNHEENYFIFTDPTDASKTFRIERFPYATDSGPVAFAASFVHPTNGPQSEGADFPTYKENVYSYTYGNAAVVVLNSEYWKSTNTAINGAPEAYMMDGELQWLRNTIQTLNADSKIDHIFVAMHSDIFPTGTHTTGSMWFSGNNAIRPLVAGKPAEQGVLERRDQLLDICINGSSKVEAFLTGGEHNFYVLKVDPQMGLYPDHYTPAKLTRRRPFYVINSGGGGGYAYARMNGGVRSTPWSDKFQVFAAPDVMALIRVNGAHVTLNAYNPRTFETVVDSMPLR